MRVTVGGAGQPRRLRDQMKCFAAPLQWVLGAALTMAIVFALGQRNAAAEDAAPMPMPDPLANLVGELVAPLAPAIGEAADTLEPIVDAAEPVVSPATEALAAVVTPAAEAVAPVVDTAAPVTEPLAPAADALEPVIDLVLLDTVVDPLLPGGSPGSGTDAGPPAASPIPATAPVLDTAASSALVLATPAIPRSVDDAVVPTEAVPGSLGPSLGSISPAAQATETSRTIAAAAADAAVRQTLAMGVTVTLDGALDGASKATARDGATAVASGAVTWAANVPALPALSALTPIGYVAIGASSAANGIGGAFGGAAATLSSFPSLALAFAGWVLINGQRPRRLAAAEPPVPPA